MTAAPPTVGDRIGPWRVVRLLGTGGACDVYLARDEQGLEVALKLLRAEASQEDPRLTVRFEREGALLSRLRHPNVVRLHGQGRDEQRQRYWLALEHVAGEDLGRLIARRGRLGAPEVVSVLRGCAEALQAAHQLGVLHRDVKAQNVLLTAAGAPKLVDFGLALVRGRDQVRLTARDEVPGTLCYLAPEVLGGSDWSPASDLYALGVLGHLLLSGSFPFADLEPARLVQAHLHARPPDLAALGAPIALAALIDLLLAKSPGQRPTAQELALALELTG